MTENYDFVPIKCNKLCEVMHITIKHKHNPEDCNKMDPLHLNTIHDIYGYM